MKHIKTLTTRNLKESMKKGGCGECQTSCQSACKTSCTVGNQSCEKMKIIQTQKRPDIKQRVTSLLIMRSGVRARRIIFFHGKEKFQ